MNKKIAKKISFYITFSACVAALWMLVVRFDYPAATFITYAIICIVFLVILIAVAAFFAFLLRYFFSAKAESNDSKNFANLTSNKVSSHNAELENSKPIDSDKSKQTDLN